MCDIDLSQLDFTVTETSPSVVCLQEDWGAPTPEHQGIRKKSPEFPSGIPKTLNWLRIYEIELRDSLLLEHDDCGILNIAEEDGCALTCLGDIQRERDRAVCRVPDIA